MDTQTLAKIRTLLTMEIDELEVEIGESNLHGCDLDFDKGRQRGLKDFREQLRKLMVIHTELNKEE